MSIVCKSDHVHTEVGQAVSDGVEKTPQQCPALTVLFSRLVMKLSTVR